MKYYDKTGTDQDINMQNYYFFIIILDNYLLVWIILVKAHISYNIGYYITDESLNESLKISTSKCSVLSNLWVAFIQDFFKIRSRWVCIEVSWFYQLKKPYLNRRGTYWLFLWYLEPKQRMFLICLFVFLSIDGSDKSKIVNFTYM